eukprot:4005719-Prymnesium_polylepis.1
MLARGEQLGQSLAPQPLVDPARTPLAQLTQPIRTVLRRLTGGSYEAHEPGEGGVWTASDPAERAEELPLRPRFEEAEEHERD